MTTTHDDYEDLAAQAERGALEAVPGTVRRGEDAAAAGRAALLEATGAISVDDAMLVALGRPPLGRGKPTTRVWKVRAPSDLDALALKLAKQEGVNLSALVRKAVAEYAATHAR